MIKLETYEDWKHCIIQICKIPLTLDFVQRRLAELRDPKDFGTQRFVDVWGRDHLARTIAWFERAKGELSHARN